MTTPRAENSAGANSISNNNDQNTTTQMDDRLTALSSDMWTSFFRGMAESFRNNADASTPKTNVKKMKPNERLLPTYL